MTDQRRDTASSPVSLTIPCRPEYVALCRLVAGALGARDSLDKELVADLKVIVTEACNCVLSLAAAGRSPREPACGECEGEDSGLPGCSLRMEFTSGPGAIVISVIYPEQHELVSWLERCGPTSEAGLGLTILKALTDEMIEFDTAEGTALRLTKLLPA